MKRETFSTIIVRCLTLSGLIFFACIVSARAQVRPFVDCVERVNDSTYRAYFGYVSLNSQPTTLIIDSPNNFFTPIPDPEGQPETFYPGVHRRAVAVNVPLNTNETWFLNGGYAQSAFKPEMSCGADGANSRAFTYQGRLTDSSTTPTNGAYDLRFQLFNAATGGAARTATLDLEDVSVTNGIFTVSLDFGLNPAILDGGNTFIEIGVRAGNSTAAFTTLTPRQPITAVPLAMRANTATNAFRAVNADNAINAANALKLGGIDANLFLTGSIADTYYIRNLNSQQEQQTANFNISGNGTIGGTLSANTININSANENVFRGTSSSTVGTRLALQNTTTGGATWNVISTGSSNGEGAGKLIFFSETSNTAPLQISGSEANVFGNLTVSGAISGATKNFKIDHPLDPQNKYLNYTSVESPDMMNIYNGNTTTDDKGEAIVTMPAYFEALNKEFRYQLTVIGQFAQAIVAEEIKENQFKIRTDKPNVKISWQVTGIRRDKFADDNRPVVEETKSVENQGKCLYAPACQNKPKQ